jgi:hypothetical protein
MIIRNGGELPVSPAILDLCFAWNWQYDSEFARILANACQAQNVTLLEVTPANLEATLSALAGGQLSFRAFFDRASDMDDNYMPLVDWAESWSDSYINRYNLARKAWDKSAMHQKLTRAGLNAPVTIVVPSFSEQPVLRPADLCCLGKQFAIKPAHGGGGKGVVCGATCWEQVLEARQEFPNDQYLLQAQVEPADLEGRQAWFRLIYAFKQIYPCWWEPQTHRYALLTPEDEERFGLCPLREILVRLSRICRLELFSSEVALTPAGQFLVVDYINDPIDLRSQSQAFEGVPDSVVEAIANGLVNHIILQRKTWRVLTW